MKMNVVICFWKVRLFWFFFPYRFFPFVPVITATKKKKALRVRSSPVTVRWTKNASSSGDDCQGEIERSLARFFSRRQQPREKGSFTPRNHPGSPARRVQDAKSFLGLRTTCSTFCKCFEYLPTVCRPPAISVPLLPSPKLGWRGQRKHAMRYGSERPRRLDYRLWMLWR